MMGTENRPFIVEFIHLKTADHLFFMLGWEHENIGAGGVS